MNTNDFSNIKAGDTLIRREGNHEELVKVTSTNETKLIVGREEFSLRTGGVTGRGSSDKQTFTRVIIPTPEAVERIKTNKLVSIIELRMNTLNREWAGSHKLVTLIDIAEMLNNGIRDIQNTN